MATLPGFATLLLPLLLCGLHAGAPSAAQAADAEIRDLRGGLPLPATPPFALTAGTVTGAALTAGYLMLRRKRRYLSLAPVPCAAGETPLGTLNRCAALYRAGDLSAELLCLNLAPLIRSTLASKSGLPVSRLTTAELLQRMRGEALLPETEIALAAGLLQLCDRVKFAGDLPVGLEAERFLAGVTRLVSGEPEGVHEIP